MEISVNVNVRLLNAADFLSSFQNEHASVEAEHLRKHHEIREKELYAENLKLRQEVAAMEEALNGLQRAIEGDGNPQQLDMFRDADDRWADDDDDDDDEPSPNPEAGRFRGLEEVINDIAPPSNEEWMRLIAALQMSDPEQETHDEDSNQEAEQYDPSQTPRPSI